MSSDLQWMIIRNNSSFMVKKRNVKKPFSKEPNNLKNVHSFFWNGLVHKKAIGIEPASDGKGAVLVYKKRRYQSKPAQSLARVPLKRGARRSLKTVSKFIRANNYRRGLKMAALRRTSAILRSQRPIVIKKKKPTGRKAE